MLPMWFRAILRRQPFSSSLSRKLIFRPSQERSFHNFRAQSLPIFVILPKYSNQCDFVRFGDANLFRVAYRTPYYPGPPESAPFIIFACDCFQYSLFGLNMLPMRFCAILRRQPFPSSLSRTLISRPSRESSFYNFCARLLGIFVYWPKFAARAISYDSEMATFFE